MNVENEHLKRSLVLHIKKPPMWNKWTVQLAEKALLKRKYTYKKQKLPDLTTREFSSKSNYASEGAPTGQVPAQAPQLTQVSASITYLPSPSEIAFTGHPSAQAPQAMQSSEITYAMLNYLHISIVPVLPDERLRQRTHSVPLCLYYIVTYFQKKSSAFLKFSHAFRSRSQSWRGGSGN